MKDRVWFYKSWHDAIKALPENIRLEIYDSVMGYIFGNPMENVSDMAKVALGFICKDIEQKQAREAHISGVNRQNGQKGGRPKTEEKEPKKLVDKQSAMKDREQEFYNSLVPYVGQYGKEMIREFFDYFSEPNKSKTKMRFEDEKKWDIKRRLERWKKRSQESKTSKLQVGQQFNNERGNNIVRKSGF